MKPGEFTLLQQARSGLSKKVHALHREDTERRLAYQLLAVQFCSRCERHPDAGGGLSPGRAWCRECQNERCRDLYHRRKAAA